MSFKDGYGQLRENFDPHLFNTSDLLGCSPVESLPRTPTPQELAEHRHEQRKYDEIIEKLGLEVVDSTYQELAVIQDRLNKLILLKEELGEQKPWLILDGVSFEDQLVHCDRQIIDLKGKAASIEGVLKNHALELGKRSIELNDETKKLTSTMNRLTWFVAGVAVLQLVIGAISLFQSCSAK